MRMPLPHQWRSLCRSHFSSPDGFSSLVPFSPLSLVVLGCGELVSVKVDFAVDPRLIAILLGAAFPAMLPKKPWAIPLSLGPNVMLFFARKEPAPSELLVELRRFGVEDNLTNSSSSSSSRRRFSDNRSGGVWTTGETGVAGSARSDAHSCCCFCSLVSGFVSIASSSSSSSG